MKLPLLCLAAAVAVGCVDGDEWDRAELAYGHGNASLEVLEQGRDVYARHCVGCHGVDGRGDGPAAPFLDPKPRDLTIGKIKFAKVPAGELPRDEDLLQVITEGLHGTSMPSWRLLSLEQREAVVAYIKSLSDAYAKKSPGTPVAVGKDPWRRNPAKGIAEGERVYHGIAGCTTCHAAYAPRPTIAEHLSSYDIAVEGFRDDLYDSIAKDSQWGEPIVPPDFLFDPIKTGFRRDSLVDVIAAGVGGTAMPTWAGGLTDRQLWGLAYYVESLALMRGTPAAFELREALLAQPPYEVSR